MFDECSFIKVNISKEKYGYLINYDTNLYDKMNIWNRQTFIYGISIDKENPIVYELTNQLYNNLIKDISAFGYNDVLKIICDDKYQISYPSDEDLSKILTYFSIIKNSKQSFSLDLERCCSVNKSDCMLDYKCGRFPILVNQYQLFFNQLNSSTDTSYEECNEKFNYQFTKKFHS